MKKKILTLGLFVAMMLGAAQISASDAKVVCVNYTNYECDFTATVCGSTFNEMEEQAEIWDELWCN